MLSRLMSLLPERNTIYVASVLVLGVISSKGDVMPPHFFDTGAEGPCQAEHRGPWHRGEALDGACCRGMSLRVPAGQSPAHTTKITQDGIKANLKNHCPKEIWPPSSLDFNPLYSFM
jgi:hypothetical protein